MASAPYRRAACQPPLRALFQRSPGSSFQGSRQALGVVCPDAADVAALEAKLDGVEAGDVVETKAAAHADAETVPPRVAHDRDADDVGAREPMTPKPGTEVPAHVVLVHLDGERGEQPC